MEGIQMAGLEVAIHVLLNIFTSFSQARLYCPRPTSMHNQVLLTSVSKLTMALPK